ncbi:MAG TPA: glycine dehydrogenase, partial [Spirochaetia bacterium]|nr:glycine dehydrogenase [Spirochaetia bacterium]
MPFIPTTDADREEMLKTIGVKTIDELFTDIPKDVRYPRLGIGKGLSELEVLRELESMAAKNTTANSCAWFLGAGAYNHFIPSLVPQLAS